MSVLRLCFLVVLLCGTIGALKSQPRPEAEAATLEITAADRARGLSFAPDVTAADREWILAAVAKARPEAARLLEEVDGLVTVTTFNDPDAWALGWAERKGPKHYEVRFNASRLNGSRRIDRDVVALHELGHVLDYAIVPGSLRDRLRAQVPKTGACPEGVRADCAPAQERFADTFAKWALRGAGRSPAPAAACAPAFARGLRARRCPRWPSNSTWRPRSRGDRHGRILHHLVTKTPQ